MTSAREWAAWQAIDNRRRTRRFAWLGAMKAERMRVSAHAFLRGSAPLFYALLDDLPLGSLARRTGWIVGDMHLENVGAYRTERGDMAFDLNDFDAGCVGPLAYDVLRLLTSVLLSSRA